MTKYSDNRATYFLCQELRLEIKHYRSETVYSNIVNPIAGFIQDCDFVTNFTH